MKYAAPVLLAAVAACSAPAPSNRNDATPSATTPTPTPMPSISATARPTPIPTPIPTTTPIPAPTPPPVEPPAPGTPDGLPDDRTPIPEGPIGKTSAQGAAQVVQHYYALIEQGRYRRAWALWSDGGRSSGMNARAFARSFDKYAEYHAEIGAPGRIEGAAGSLYVEVPVVAYGRLESGDPFRLKGPVTLRRCNDVPGCTAEQRAWHIASTGLKPRPKA
ncbi:hypothetical protein [Sphingomonas sp.]|uniref:hypothetical protein n=1 Tax=Sphingomonas sp. TaxID=28214 RepID=UPI002DB7B4E2|nr:hypothetical protein [Sphingomonas sp.]HEU4967987.1 hypothetical protein [Sphingomonas sp.]